MTRKLKFRAWTGEKMIFSESGQFYSISANIQVKSSTGNEFYDKDYPVMQWTGLTDKNGIDIYEGDLISVPYITPFGDNTESENEDLRTHVVFEFGEFCLKYPTHAESLKSYCNRKKGEYISNFGNRLIFEAQTILTVIGNIYQKTNQ